MVLIAWNNWPLEAGLALILTDLCVISSDVSPVNPDKLSEYTIHDSDIAVCAQLLILDRVKLGTMLSFNCADLPFTKLNALINAVLPWAPHPFIPWCLPPKQPSSTCITSANGLSCSACRKACMIFCLISQVLLSLIPQCLDNASAEMLFFIWGHQVHRQKPNFEWAFAILHRCACTQGILFIARCALYERTAL